MVAQHGFTRARKFPEVSHTGMELPTSRDVRILDGTVELRFAVNNMLSTSGSVSSASQLRAQAHIQDYSEGQEALLALALEYDAPAESLRRMAERCRYNDRPWRIAGSLKSSAE
jgi:hypothetical protein